MTDAPTNPYAKKAWGRSIHDLWLENGEGISDPHDPPRYSEDKRLHPAEWELLRCASNGTQYVCGAERPTEVVETNYVRALLVCYVALGADDYHPLHDRGVQLQGAYISGDLNLLGSTIPKNLSLINCRIDGLINLRDSKAETLNLEGCSINALFGDRLESNGSIYLRGKFEAAEIVRLTGARVGGGLDCSNGKFNGLENSLQCDSIETKGTVFLRNGFKAKGTVRFHGASIAGDLVCKSSCFLAPDISLSANRARIRGHIFLNNGFQALGKVSFEDITVETGISCVGGNFRATDQALSLKFSTIDGNVDFGIWKDKDAPDGRLPCSFSGGVSLQRVRINGDLIFTETSFDSGCIVNLRNAKIEGQLYWRQIQQAETKSETHVIDSTEERVEQAPSMVSELNLAGATCLTLNMDWDSWSLPSQVRLDHFTYDGFSELPSNWNANRWVEWLERQPKKHLNERFRPHPYQQLAKVLHESGFEDEALKIRIERREKQRIFMRDHEPVSDGLWAWGFRKLNNFWRWVQKVFIGHGYRPGTAVIWLLALIAIGASIYEVAARHGIMTPSHPLIFKEAVWKPSDGAMPVGKVPFACRENWIHPPDNIRSRCEATIPTEYSSFSSLLYSLDVAIPVVNFRMENDWAPRVVNWQTGQSANWSDFPLWGWGWWVRTWEWFQIGAGWALSLLFVSAIGGVIRRD